MRAFLTQLDADWRQLSTSDAAGQSLRRWAVANPGLRAGNLDELLRGRLVASEARTILAALAALAPTDEIAARTLLQALVPGLVTMAKTAGAGDQAAIEDLVALAWQRIRTYPGTRHGSVPANVLLDVRKWYWRDRAIDCARAVRVVNEPIRSETSAEDQALIRMEAEEALRSAAPRISRKALRVIVRSRMGDVPLADIAAEEGVTVSAITMRRHRAEHALRRHFAS